MNSKAVDIVFVNYNSTRYLLKSLERVFHLSGGRDVKVFVVDNASQESLDVVTERFPAVCLIRNTVNEGFAAAANRALSRGGSPFVVLVNPDTLIQEGFLETAVGYMESHPSVGVLGPRILNPDGTLQGSARGFPGVSTFLFGRSSLLTRWFPENPLSRKNVLALDRGLREPLEVDWVSGACMVVRRKAFEAVGLLDDGFFMYWEDADWCRRMWDADWKVVHHPSVSVVHEVGGSSRTDPFRAAMAFHRSAYRYCAKYLPTRYAFAKPLIFGLLSIRLAFTFAGGGLRRALRRYEDAGGGRDPVARTDG